MVNRQISNTIVSRFNKGKVIIVTGARQVGKTTLVKQIVSEQNNMYEYWNCDEPDIREMLTNPTSTILKRLVGNNKYIIIDEAQRVENIGITLKLLVDNLQGVQVIVTGSSTLDLAGKLNEPLTGRKYMFNMYPFSFLELVSESTLLEQNRLVEERLKFGMYPEVVNFPGEEEERLNELVSSYLFKDVLMLDSIRKPELLEKLIRALALQLGNEVSYNELANTTGVDKDTVARYIDLLEKTYVIFRLKSFSKNKRREIKKRKKIYFWDIGVRNSVIRNFNDINIRTDKSVIWENFIISERLKLINNHKNSSDSFYWRTVQNQEIDYIEESGNNIIAYDIKWSAKRKPGFPETFRKLYPGSKFHTINRENYYEYITD